MSGVEEQAELVRQPAAEDGSRVTLAAVTGHRHTDTVCSQREGGGGGEQWERGEIGGMY